MEKKKKYERKVFKDVIRDAIYDAIVDGELKPGDRVSEMDWAKRFNSSQAPVREAIRDLASQGVVESIPFKGAFVRIITPKELNDIEAIRCGLEAVALGRDIENISDDTIQKMRKIYEDMLEAARKKDEKAFLNEDIAFHSAIVDECGMPDLKRMWDMCNIHLWTSFSTSNSRYDLSQLAESHKKILDKIESRNSKGIFEVLMDHFEFIAESIDYPEKDYDRKQTAD